MSMNEMPAAERVHISFFGCRNAGKSSLVNAVTGQAVSVVSEVKGTTTDPVSKTMELLPLGPVVITDTPGFDDASGLGSLRVERTRQILRRTDLAVLVADSTAGLQETDRELLRLFGERNIPFLVAMNKQDLCRTVPEDDRTVAVSALTGEGIRELKERMARLLPGRAADKCLIADLVRPADCVVLVCPIDESAPKGRLILPQQHAIRDLLEAGALPLVTRETELPDALSALASPPRMVVTDSQAFRAVAPRVPEEIPLTSFSILMARYRGFLETAVRGVAALRSLRDGSRVLMAEGCTHHRQCNDIGTVKIPRWLREHTGRTIEIDTCSGPDFPEDLSPYAAVIHCGGCMITEKEVQARREMAEAQGVPFTNYGLVIAHITGVLERSLRLFPEIHALLGEGFE
ncbi:[FeFe] hydrogenase H-cluster maturation GTPase HydF [Clostridiales bacterium]|nr:[FeFe] hydrogenase H-cluster maturation GTPase HydF [Clostridiales bacterium]